jgi:hypothetical protein
LVVNAAWILPVLPQSATSLRHTGTRSQVSCFLVVYGVSLKPPVSYACPRFGKDGTAYATTWNQEQIRVRVVHGKKHWESVGPSGTEHVFSRLAPGRYQVTGGLANYIHHTADSSMEVPPGACITADVRMVPDSMISGIVLTPQRQPAVHVQVGTAEMTPASTDDHGHFQLRIQRPGQYRITANAIPFTTFLP